MQENLVIKLDKLTILQLNEMFEKTTVSLVSDHS